jgi:hypothetical protein
MRIPSIPSRPERGGEGAADADPVDPVALTLEHGRSDGRGSVGGKGGVWVLRPSSSGCGPAAAEVCGRTCHPWHGEKKVFMGYPKPSNQKKLFLSRA